LTTACDPQLGQLGIERKGVRFLDDSILTPGGLPSNNAAGYR
jgi:hypothetical protein